VTSKSLEELQDHERTLAIEAGRGLVEKEQGSAGQFLAAGAHGQLTVD
jgi:hypothetical protein